MILCECVFGCVCVNVSVCLCIFECEPFLGVVVCVCRVCVYVRV